MSKKNEQLGMNYSTASNRLRKDILWHYVVKCGDDICHQCGKKIEDQSELSIEHKKPWLDSNNPVELFFDLDNIAFSHLSCNVRVGRKPNKVYDTPEEQKRAGHRRFRAKLSKEERKKRRREQYLRTGK